MSMRHLFGFDHIPLGPCYIPDYYDTRLKFFTGEGSTQLSTILAGGWIGAGGNGTFQAIIPQHYQDTPTRTVMGFRAKQNGTPSGSGFQGPVVVYNAGTWTAIYTAAELAANKAPGNNGDYFTLDINFVSGVIRRWINKVELSTVSVPVATLKTCWMAMTIQAYQNTYTQWQYRDIYVGDDFDGIAVNPLGDRVVRSLPVKSATGNSWGSSDATPIKDALNKAWATGATDVVASNSVDNSALRVQFNPGNGTPDIDAVQVEVAASVSGPTTSIKVARQGDATGKTTALSNVIKWGARSPVYQSKADGSKISTVDLAAMNFDISGA